MERIHIGTLVLSGLMSAGLAAQNPQPSAKPLAFEATDIHPSPFSFAGQYFHQAPFADSRFIIHQATPMDLITYAYRVEPDAVTGGPPGLQFDRYDIVARTPPGTAQDDTPRMLQSLLADRFKLAVTTEIKPLPAFLLKADKTPPIMKPTADPDGESGCFYRPPDPPPPPNTPTPSTITLKCSNITMGRFAGLLNELAWAYVNHPVVDATDLKGAWDFDLRFTWRSRVPDAITIFKAVEKLGLKLDAGTSPRSSVSIVHMAELPTPNAAGIEKLLPPPPPPSFEVAVIRPSQNESKEVQERFTGNQVTISATQLRLIAMAWDISVKTIVDTPAFMDKQIWEVTAKLPIPDTPPTPGKRTQIDYDQVRLMMRSLLAERFGLKTHLEDRPGIAYALLPGTPKLKKADPANRASCSNTPAPGEKNPRLANPLLTQYMHCDNVTMDEFARELQGYSGYVIKTPVRNATGIEGRYDVTLSFSGIHTLENLAAGGTGDPAATGDSTGVPLTIEDAVAKQLGLKLELEHRPIPALVIDHINEKPVEN
jgi:uncharacterized protein (TIGR03435 family)